MERAITRTECYNHSPHVSIYLFSSVKSLSFLENNGVFVPNSSVLRNMGYHIWMFVPPHTNWLLLLIAHPQKDLSVGESAINRMKWNIKRCLVCHSLLRYFQSSLKPFQGSFTGKKCLKHQRVWSDVIGGSNCLSAPEGFSVCCLW